MNEAITWGIVVALAALFGWVVKVTLAYGRLEASAVDAKRIAGEAAQTAKEEAKRIVEIVKRETDPFPIGLAALNAAFNLFQVQVAEKYITRDVLKEFEDRLTESRRETIEVIRGDIKELRTRIEQLSRPNGRRTK